jgi:hypothetical protein
VAALRERTNYVFRLHDFFRLCQLRHTWPALSFIPKSIRQVGSSACGAASPQPTP